MQLGKYSIGVGDRFGRQGQAQLGALTAAAKLGLAATPVWNKSHREHTIIGTQPGDTRRAADAAVAAAGWKNAYFVDADHIGLATVDGFIDACDFFTLDVADFSGRPAAPETIAAFVDRHADLLGTIELPNQAGTVDLDRQTLTAAARKYLLAVQQAGAIYRHLASRKGTDRFVVEISMDETDLPQTPTDLLIILAAVADEAIPAQTIAPKFSGRFNKGVDYVGDLATFAAEFERDLAVIAHAVGRFALPANLKLSVHSGSDKFAIYGAIRQALAKTGAGLHLKTAGTTWLEELIGLARAGGDGLRLAKQVYRQALARYDELCGPYAPVIDIQRQQLPTASTVDAWNGETFAAALRHDANCPLYDPNLRQLLHVGYKVAAEMGQTYLDCLDQCQATIAAGVRENLLEKHLMRVFPGGVTRNDTDTRTCTDLHGLTPTATDRNRSPRSGSRTW